jgi:bacterioferritin-associated ferredoxin
MIVCVCNALRERDCREAAGDPEVRRAGCVYRRLNCRVRCGACVATMKAIVDELRDERAARQATALPPANTALAEPELVE